MFNHYAWMVKTDPITWKFKLRQSAQETCGWAACVKSHMWVMEEGFQCLWVVCLVNTSILGIPSVHPECVTCFVNWIVNVCNWREYMISWCTTFGIGKWSLPKLEVVILLTFHKLCRIPLGSLLVDANWKVGRFQVHTTHSLYICSINTEMTSKDISGHVESYLWYSYN